MIVIDTSAIIAVLNREPEAELFSALIVDADRAVLSTATLIEATLVASRFRTPVFDPDSWLDEFVRLSGIEVEPLTNDHAQLARAAHRRYGKGTGHGAGLNFGDCFSYALAKSLDAPLLYKGGDFARTDIVSAAG